MSEDALYLLICYLIYGVTLAVLVYRRKRRKLIVAINLGILLAYSVPLLYALNMQSQGGAALVWLIYLMLAIGVHWAINMIGLTRILKSRI